jgi:hypothetical protein
MWNCAGIATDRQNRTGPAALERRRAFALDPRRPQGDNRPSRANCPAV